MFSESAELYDRIYSFKDCGYVRTLDGLHAAIRCMARHLEPGGALLVEPWFGPDEFRRGLVGVTTHEEPGLAIVRMSRTSAAGTVSFLDFEYLVGHPDGITRASERHAIGL